MTGAVDLAELAGKSRPELWPTVFRDPSDLALDLFGDADWRYIAAASPDVILALLADARKLREALREVWDHLDEHECPRHGFGDIPALLESRP